MNLLAAVMPRPGMATPAGSDASPVPPFGNALFLWQMLVSRSEGRGVMPPRLGLEPDRFEWVMRRHFPNDWPNNWFWLFPEEGLMEDPGTAPGLDDEIGLIDLLMAHRSVERETAAWAARVVAVGCQGANHLWEDLGLWSRGALGAFLSHNFRPLAESNIGDMKWKKFLYRRLCEQSGLRLCPAPSCGECADYSTCFGAEE